MSTALENLKAGTVATYNYLSVLIAYAGYKFFKLVLLKRELLFKNRDQWLAKDPAHKQMILDAQVSKEELTGVILIIGFSAMLMLSILNDEEAYVPPTQKNKEKFLIFNNDINAKLCKECL